MHREEMEREYQIFKVKFSIKIKEMQEDFDKLSNINKERFQKDIKQLLKAKFPHLLKFLQND